MLSINDLHEDEYASLKQHFEAVAALKLQEKYNEIHDEIETTIREGVGNMVGSYEEAYAEWEKVLSKMKDLRLIAFGFHQACILLGGKELTDKLWEDFKTTRNI